MSGGHAGDVRATGRRAGVTGAAGGHAAGGFAAGMRVIGPEDGRSIRAVTDLHLQLLPWGPMAGLGRLFLRRFCYTLLIRDGLMEAALFEVDGEPAGFIAYTTRSLTLHREALMRRPGAAALLLAGSVLANPAVLVRLVKGARLLFSRRTEKRAGGDPQAEVLAIGVLPAYRTPVFARRAGLRISRELVLHAARRFHQAGMREMRMVVDAFNKPALLFYHGLGGRFEQYRRAGDPMVQVRFDLDALLQGAAELLQRDDDAREPSPRESAPRKKAAGGACS